MAKNAGLIRYTRARVSNEQYNPRTVARAEFDAACEAVWSEIVYQNTLSRRTEDEAKDPAGFFTLARVYLRRGEDAWSDNAGTEACLPSLRKVAAILVRGMIYCGVRSRVVSAGK